MSRARKTIKFIILSILFAVIFNIGADSALALEEGGLWGNQAIEQNVETEIGLGSDDPRVIIARLINIFLGFLGIIAVILILYAGFLYMTSEGDIDKTDKAKKLLISAIIGLVIILASFGLANFVMSMFTEATGLPPSTSQGGRGTIPSGFGSGAGGGLPLEGQPCATNPLDNTCSAGECGGDLKCDSTDCTCKQNLPGEGDAC